REMEMEPRSATPRRRPERLARKAVGTVGTPEVLAPSRLDVVGTFVGTVGTSSPISKNLEQLCGFACRFSHRRLIPTKEQGRCPTTSPTTLSPSNLPSPSCWGGTRT